MQYEYYYKYFIVIDDERFWLATGGAVLTDLSFANLLTDDEAINRYKYQVTKDAKRNSTGVLYRYRNEDDIQSIYTDYSYLDNDAEKEYVFILKSDPRLAIDYLTSESGFEYVSLLDYVDITSVSSLSVDDIHPFKKEDFYMIPSDGKSVVTLSDIIKSLAKE